MISAATETPPMRENRMGGVVITGSLSPVPVSRRTEPLPERIPPPGAFGQKQKLKQE